MSTTKLLPLTAALLITAIGSTAANANVISLMPAAQSAGVGADITFEVRMDFINTTVGGAFDVFYDASILSYVSFEFAPGFADPDFAISPDDCFVDGAAISGCSVGDPELNGIGFGDFDGLTGSHLVGLLTFQTIDTGVAVLSMATNDEPWGGFFSAIDASELVVVYGPGKVHVVPIPAAVWLFASGLGLLAGWSRRRRT